MLRRGNEGGSIPQAPGPSPGSGEEPGVEMERREGGKDQAGEGGIQEHSRERALDSLYLRE